MKKVVMVLTSRERGGRGGKTKRGWQKRGWGQAADDVFGAFGYQEVERGRL